ncbi:S-adenosyl-L-methionine-dependent methyltransferase [Ganoderma leucocontextum]|nr:S-adenosyl-L-methionine-dependent methyltransferase [Ganoderma leucocontextum]
MKRGQPIPSASTAKKARTGPSMDIRRDDLPSVWVEIPKRRTSSVVPTHYIPAGDETFEDDLIVSGEASDWDDEGDDVPIRLLNHFSVFHRVTKEFIPTFRLVTEEVCEDWVGTGFVHPYFGDATVSENDDCMESELVQLSSLLDCSVHWVTKHGRSYSLDQKIYVLTAHGWYILQSPALSYAPHYNSLQTHHSLAHAFLSYILEAPDTSLDGLLLHSPSSFSKEDLASPAFDIYLHAVLSSWPKVHTRLIQKIITSPAVQELPLPLTSALPPLHHSSKSNTEEDEEDDEYKEEEDQEDQEDQEGTVVTPRVGAIAQRLFSQPLHIVEMSGDGRHAACQKVPSWPVHLGDPKAIEWGERIGDSNAYQAVVLDGTTYRVGDVVIVNPGEDIHKIRAEHATLTSGWCKNNLATQKWFCKINYFYEESGPQRQKFFHAQWLQHGSQTFLQEAAHSRALFWLNECDDLPVECVYSHCNLQPWPLGEVEPLEDIAEPENHFFTGLTLDDTAHSFSHLSPHEVEQALSYCDELKPCVACGLSALGEQSQKYVPLVNGGIAYKGIDYHDNDFVYHHNHSGSILHIGQIIEFIPDQADGPPKLKVCQYGRYDDIAKTRTKGPTPIDNRRLFKTEACILVEIAEIEGKPFVACPSSSWEKEHWVKANDHFYCDLIATNITPQVVKTLEPSALDQCLQCCAQALEAQMEEELLVKRCPKLRGLELFAGAGGLSTGLDLSGCIQTKWAVELSSSAAKTFQANHRDTVVYNQDTSRLLQHAIDMVEGHHPEPLQSQLGVELPPMPQRGEVDFIYGGPPCQSFSTMNHNKDINDPRSTMVCNMISYVEFYRPMYFLLENVRGILFAQTIGQQEIVVIGVVKFIIRALTTLGYQVHFKVLQAGNYGAPQGRQRVIFLGARCDVPLPQFPAPQHYYPKPVLQHHLPNGEALHPHFRPTSCDNVGYMPCVPLPATTIAEAIGDLPSFDWENPHIKIPAKEEQVQQAEDRLAQGTICMQAIATPEKALIGFDKPVSYPHPPLSRYQSWIRGDNNLVTYHYTKQWHPSVVESVLNVPLHANANHADLPKVLQNPKWLKSNGESKPAYTTIYGRLDNDGCFMTALTTLVPNQKGGKVIHPTQHRIITIREAARAQGFPDSYQFLSTEDKSNKCLQDQARQIGNAVPVPLAMALGREIGKSFLKVFKQKIYQDKVARVQSPEIQ